MLWKRRESNLIVVSLLSIAYTVVTLLIIIGPLHMNSTGGINHMGKLAICGVVYWIMSLLVSWGLYFAFRKDPEPLFFTLLALGIALIVAEVYLWGIMGS